MWQIKNATKLTVVPEIQAFFLGKCCAHCFKFLLNFQSSKKVYLTVFYKHSHCFCGGKNFWRYSTMSLILPFGSSLCLLCLW